MTTRKTSSLKSRTTSSKTSTGKKETSSRGVSNTGKSSSPKSKTQTALEKNQQCLTTTGTQPKKKKSASTSTAKAKAKSTKTTTKSTTSTSKRRTKKPTEIKVMNSRKLEYFPHVETFPIFLNDLTENKRCWFTCIEHAQKYITRYNHKYKCYQYTGS